MTDHQTNRHGRRGEVARGRHQESTRQRSGGSRGAGRGRAARQVQSESEGNFREDTEIETPQRKAYEDPISPELRAQLDAVCEEASAALITRDVEAARAVFRQRVKPQLRIFYHTSFESLYCLMFATYVIGNKLKRKYGRGSRTPMYKAIVGDVSRRKVYLEVLKGCIAVPKQEPQRKTVQTRLSGYNCALEQAYHEGLTEDQLLYRLTYDGGLDRLLSDGRERTAEEKGRERVKKQTVSAGVTSSVLETSSDQEDLFDPDESWPTARSHGGLPTARATTKTAAAKAPSCTQPPVDALLQVGDEAMRSITQGRGRHVAIIDIAHAKPPTVTIELAQSLPHHDCDDDEQALDRMITSVRSPKSKK